MFEIPENLPPRLGPLAWLVGNWQGWGTLVTLDETAGEAAPGGDAADEATSDQPLLQEISVEIAGEQLRMHAKFFAATATGEVDPMWDATQGLDALEPGELLWEETLYWTVTSPLALVPADGEAPREIRATAASSRGYAILWAGVTLGPRIRLDSDAIAMEPTATPVDHMSRMLGLVGGELMWASDNKVGEADFETEFTGRLRRATKGDA